MACFLVPMAQAAATRLVRKRIGRTNCNPKSPWIAHLPKLELMLWGGSVMLVADHVANGEISPAYPFFTALAREGGAAELAREMLTNGLAMSAAVTLLYVALVALVWRRVASRR